MNKREMLTVVDRLINARKAEGDQLERILTRLDTILKDVESMQGKLDKTGNQYNRCERHTVYKGRIYHCEVIGVPHTNHVAHTPGGVPIRWDGERQAPKLNWLDSDAEQCSARDDNNLRCLILGKHVNHLTSTGICHRW